MVIKKKISNKNTLSKSSDKKGELLIKVDQLMEKLDNDYGPLLLEELQKRLENTIEEFHSDLKTILEQTFDKHNSKTKNNLESDVPTFIAEFNPDGSTGIPKYYAVYNDKNIIVAPTPSSALAIQNLCKSGDPCSNIEAPSCNLAKYIVLF